MITENYNNKELINKNLEIEDVLLQDEEILWRSKPNKRAYILSAFVKLLPFVLIWIVFDVTFITLLAVNFGSKLGYMWIFIGVFMLIHLTPVWIWIANLLKRRMEISKMDYAITNKRIIIRKGAIGIDFVLIPFNEINCIKCVVEPSDKLFSVGDITIFGNRSVGTLYDIDQPYQMNTKLVNIMERMKENLQTDLEPIVQEDLINNEPTEL